MTQIERRMRSAACLSVLLLASTACANEASPSATPPTRALASADAEGIWLAALRVDADPNALDADTRTLKDVLGGALIVSPASCFRGLPATVDDSAYVLGVQASTREDLRAFVVRTDRDPVFEVRVQMLCTD